MIQKLPRIKIAGAQVFNTAIEAIVSRVEYLYNGSGDVSYGATGPVYKSSSPVTSRLAQVTTAVPAGDGRLGYSIAGRVTFLDDTGTPLVLNPAFTGIPVKNRYEKGFLVGAVVRVDLIGGSWWSTDPGKCADYGP